MKIGLRSSLPTEPSSTGELPPWLCSGWCSYHFFYHASRNLLLSNAILPLVWRLSNGGHIERFFFIRYPLGGPHIRLRLLARDGEESFVEEQVREAACAFFARHGSQETLSEEDIQRENAALLAGDPNEHDDTVYPDNSLRHFAFRPEIERYGGAQLLAPTLDFFAVSSAQALAFVAAHGTEPWSRQLPGAFRLLARQAWSLAADLGEMRELLGYAVRFWKDTPLARIAEHGDKVFTARRDVFVSLLRGQLEALADIENAEIASDTSAAVLLGSELQLAAADADLRWRVKASHMHMLANRLGLLNPEEIYLSRLLWRAAGALLDDGGKPLLAAALAARDSWLDGPPLAERTPTLCRQLLARAAAHTAAATMVGSSDHAAHALHYQE